MGGKWRCIEVMRFKRYKPPEDYIFETKKKLYIDWQKPIKIPIFKEGKLMYMYGDLVIEIFVLFSLE